MSLEKPHNYSENKQKHTWTRSERPSVDYTAVYILLACSLMSIPLQLVGTVRVGELILLAGSLLLAQRLPAISESRYFRSTIFFGVLWLMSQVVSDYVNETEVKNTLRGVANIGMVLFSFCVYCALFVENYRYFYYFLYGGVLSGVLNVLLPLSVSKDQDINYVEFWDFYVSSWATPLLILVCVYTAIKFRGFILFLGVAYFVAAIVLGGRSDALIALSGTLIIFLVRSVRSETLSSLPWWRIGFGATVLLIPFFLAYVHYGLSGVLGDKTNRELVAIANPYNPLQVILSARTESSASLEAIYDKPLLGHGSWAYDRKYDEIYIMKLRSIRPDVKNYQNIQKVIPVHSVILSAWVFGGILGFVFWGGAILRYLKVSLALLKTADSFIVCSIGLFIPYLLWHVTFSPMGFARYSWPANMAFVLCAYSQIFHNSAVQRQFRRF